MNGMKATFLIALSVSIDVQYPKQDNGNDHRAAAKVMQAEKAARPAAPCATYCYHAIAGSALWCTACHASWRNTDFSRVASSASNINLLSVSSRFQSNPKKSFDS